LGVLHSTRAHPQNAAHKTYASRPTSPTFPQLAAAYIGCTATESGTPKLRKDITMNKDTIEGNWKQLKGKVQEQWGKLTDDDFDVVAGKRDQFLGKVQERYGVTKDEAEKQVALWETRDGRTPPGLWY
jgi:uncharacterized protein YjbJ (UPF0337 family)